MKILALLAHPDDETLISGTLALLAENNIPLQVVYATSGDAGSDHSNENLSGKALASIRENEVNTALKNLGINTPPLFLKFNDGTLNSNLENLKVHVQKLFDEFKPSDVISFGPDGVTGHPDHIAVGMIANLVFDKNDSVKRLLHIAISKSRAKIYNAIAKNYLAENPVSDKAINLKINIEKYFDKKISAAKSHKTQFTKNDIIAITELFSKAPYEEFMIARSRETFTTNIFPHK